MKLSGEYKFRRATAGLAVIAGTVGLAACGTANAEHNTKPTHSAVVPTSKAPTTPTPEQKTPTTTETTPSDTTPTTSLGSSSGQPEKNHGVTVSRAVAVNPCVPVLENIVQNSTTTKQVCTYSGNTLKNPSKDESDTMWYDSQITQENQGLSNFTAYIGIKKQGEGTIYDQKDADNGMLDGHDCYFSYGKNVVLNAGLFCRVNDNSDKDPNSPEVQVYISDLGQVGLQGTYQMHVEFMEAALKYLNSELGGISLSGKSEIPESVQGFGVNAIPPGSI